jgi:hypothetical protein
MPTTVRHERNEVGLSLPEAVERNVETWDSDASGEATSGRTMRVIVLKRRPGLGAEQSVIAGVPETGWSEGVMLWSRIQ